MGKNRKKSPGSFFRIALWFVTGLLLFPVAEVLAMRFVNPIFTPLMLIRRLQGRANPGPNPTPAYRWVPLAEVPESFLKALWQTEDARFFRHNGFDWVEVKQAVQDAERTGKPARGASTITMQCARSLFLWQGRSWIRKPIEAYYTILMEAILTKRRILELYANIVEMGDGLYGIEAAAQNYWRIPAKKMDASQAVMVVALLPNPRQRNPHYPSASLRRRAATIARKLRQSPPLPAAIKG